MKLNMTPLLQKAWDVPEDQLAYFSGGERAARSILETLLDNIGKLDGAEIRALATALDELATSTEEAEEYARNLVKRAREAGAMKSCQQDEMN